MPDPARPPQAPVDVEAIPSHGTLTAGVQGLEPTPPTSRKVWHIITGEYPPDVGGVGEYSMLLAEQLVRAGDIVHVWAPQGGDPPRTIAGLIVHRTLGAMRPADLGRTDSLLNDIPGPRRLLVQWVPHAFKLKSLNLPFAIWLLRRAARGDRIDLIVHEPFVAFLGGSWRQFGAALIHRLMVAAVLAASTRVWVSIPLWRSELGPFSPRRKDHFRWLPMPSNIPVVATLRERAALRTTLVPGDGILLGHFGTYGALVTDLLDQVVPRLLRGDSSAALVLIGKGSVEFRRGLLAACPDLEHRVHATGTLTPHAISAHLAACDIMLQPYPDGVSSRRGSVMAALAHGRATITTSGRATEGCWVDAQPVVIVPSTDMNAFVDEAGALMKDAPRRGAVGDAGRRLYDSAFDIGRAVQALKEATDEDAVTPLRGRLT